MRAACALVTAVLAMPASSVAAQNSGFPRAALGASAPRAIYGEQLRRFLLANGVSRATVFFIIRINGLKSGNDFVDCVE